MVQEQFTHKRGEWGIECMNVSSYTSHGQPKFDNLDIITFMIVGKMPISKPKKQIQIEMQTSLFIDFEQSFKI